MPIGSISAQNQEQLIDQIIAIVGDRIVLNSDIELQTLQIRSQGNYDANLKCSVLDQALLEKMLQHHAVVDSIAIDEQEVELELDNRLNYFLSMFGGDVAKMEEYYSKSMVQMKDEFKEDIRDQLLARKMQSQIVSGIKVTPSEVKRYFEAIPIDSLPYLDAELELNELIIKPKIAAAQKENAKQQLRELKERVDKGEDFVKIAKVYSEDPGSGPNGGDLGWMGRGQLVPEFEGAAFRLKPGELSEPVETKFGMHLIQMLERRGEKIHVRHILISPKVSDIELNAAKQRADSIRQLVSTDSMTFKQAVEKFSDDEESRKKGGLMSNPQRGTSTFSVKELDPNTYFAIDGLAQGDISPAIEYAQADGKKAYRLIEVALKTKPHVANLKDDYTKIQNIVEAQKKQQAMLKWLNNNIEKTYVYVNDQYAECDLSKWKKEYKQNNIKKN